MKADWVKVMVTAMVTAMAMKTHSRLGLTFLVAARAKSFVYDSMDWTNLEVIEPPASLACERYWHYCYYCLFPPFENTLVLVHSLHWRSLESLHWCWLFLVQPAVDSRAGANGSRDADDRGNSKLKTRE